jgi:hypothetical protein
VLPKRRSGSGSLTLPVLRVCSPRRDVQIVRCLWSAAPWKADNDRHCQDVSVGHLMSVLGGEWRCLMKMSVISKVVPVHYATKTYGGVEV